MAYISTCLGIPSNNRCVIETCSPSSYPFELPKDKRLVTGLDVSTSCIGTTITNVDMDFILMIDFSNTGETKDNFFNNYRMFMNNLLNGCDVGLCITENPVPSKWKNAGYVLRDFLGRISVMKQDIPAFSNCVNKGIFPQTWKSKVVDKSKGKNRHKTKRFIAEDICDRVPCIANYISRTIAKDFDSFDALGLILGFIDSNSVSIGDEVVPIVKGPIVHNKNFTAFFFETPIDRLNSVQEEDLGVLQAYYHNSGCKSKLYNIDYSCIENLIMTSESFACSGIMIPFSSICIRIACYFGKVLQPGMGYFCVVVNNSAIPKKWLNYGMERLPYMSFLKG